MLLAISLDSMEKRKKVFAHVMIEALSPGQTTHNLVTIFI
jgi:hypothetical protein